MTTEQTAQQLELAAQILRTGQHGNYRIKPEAPPFQLPPPPPGMQWHREDGWQEDDLPQGMRPLVYGETRLVGDDFFPTEGCDTWRNKWQTAEEGFRAQPQNSVNKSSYKSRTRRPLTFTHAGKTWTWHRPGDPCPVPPNAMVYIITRDNDFSEEPSKAEDYEWDQIEGSGRFAEIIGWRYADEKKTVPLGPEDVPPGSVFRPVGWSSIPNAYVNYEAVVTNGVRTIGKDWGEFCSEYGYLPWLELQSEWQINRSIPLTGKWNPDDWEPCSKQIDA